ncbi:MAG: hypothetical protein EPO08_15900 [Rhodospirillaceae bacterium]|nr:MAG: hypothetical protein EPO08_15900 [Rhodospirillaceae bacterium]
MSRSGETALVNGDKTASSFRDRLPLLAAVVLSTLWIALVVHYLHDLPGGLRGLSPAEAAGLLAGAGGPLAAFWLFMAVVEQRRRLALMTHALGEMLRQHRHTLQIAETQTRTLMEFQAQAKRVQAAETRRLALQDLAAHVAVLAERLGVIRREDVDVTWARFGSGDMTAFVQPFLNFAVSHPEISERLAEAVARDAVAATALHGFVRRYERLAAESADDRLIQEIVDEGALGRAFRLFKAAADGGGASSPKGNGATPSPVEPDDLLQARLADLSSRLDASAPKL